ncbi:hypothetical protein D9M71_748540 [compost metagenome]
MGLAHVLLGLAFSDMAGHFQIQAQRGQVVAEQVVQLAGNAGAPVDAGTFGQQQAQGADHGGIAQADVEMIDDALGQMAWRRGAVHHGVDVQPRWAQVPRQQGFEDGLLAVEMRV